jgi:hypothetical protein
MIFPWRPSEAIGVAALATGFAIKPLGIGSLSRTATATTTKQRLHSQRGLIVVFSADAICDAIN